MNSGNSLPSTEKKEIQKKHDKVGCEILQANRHEHVKDEQGIFTFLHRWILVLDEGELFKVQPLVSNLTHRSAVAQVINYLEWKKQFKTASSSHTTAFFVVVAAAAHTGPPLSYIKAKSLFPRTHKNRVGPRSVCLFLLYFRLKLEIDFSCIQHSGRPMVASFNRLDSTTQVDGPYGILSSRLLNTDLAAVTSTFTLTLWVFTFVCLEQLIQAE